MKNKAIRLLSCGHAGHAAAEIPSARHAAVLPLERRSTDARCERCREESESSLSLADSSKPQESYPPKEECKIKRARLLTAYASTSGDSGTTERGS